jgi:hypothetical protein
MVKRLTFPFRDRQQGIRKKIIWGYFADPEECFFLKKLVVKMTIHPNKNQCKT